MGSCAAPSAKGDDKFITTDYLQQCLFSSPPLMRHERIKVLVEKQVVLFQCPGWSGNGQNN
uniref:Uncharacterized protein n=1 Tax=Escherichia coli TaxID=562 RepID=A0A7L8K9T5_ECOLX|nr:hypothetical protein [Escherichia coli]